MGSDIGRYSFKLETVMSSESSALSALVLFLVKPVIIRDYLMAFWLSPEVST